MRQVKIKLAYYELCYLIGWIAPYTYCEATTLERKLFVCIYSEIYENLNRKGFVEFSKTKTINFSMAHAIGLFAMLKTLDLASLPPLQTTLYNQLITTLDKSINK